MSRRGLLLAFIVLVFGLVNAELNSRFGGLSEAPTWDMLTVLSVPLMLACALAILFNLVKPHE